MSRSPYRLAAALAALLGLSACLGPREVSKPAASPPGGSSPSGSPHGSTAGPSSTSPYPRSRAITAVIWDFTAVAPRAIGSDLWPCTWARDGNEYCAWGDGGGFDGNNDHIGRVSVGVARLSGSAGDFPSFTGKNVWGAPSYAEHPATFGGKIVSMISVDGTLYANGGFWTAGNTAHPVSRSGGGPTRTLARSSDLGATWQLAPWSSPGPIGAFLNFGPDNAAAPDGHVYVYYARPGDRQQVFLKRVVKDRLFEDASTPGLYEYLAGVDGRGRPRGWSMRESDARPVFFDANNVDGFEVVFDAGLHRFLATAGHYPSGRLEDESIGKLGIFESRHPWGPWATIGYYDDWGAFEPAAAGDYLGLRILLRWLSPDGKTLWCVFSGLGRLDAFNVVKGTLRTSWLPWGR
jgi:hypothetical protein